MKTKRIKTILSTNFEYFEYSNGDQFTLKKGESIKQENMLSLLFYININKLPKLERKKYKFIQ